MATYVNDLRLTELATGEGSGTWGTTTNTNLELIAEAFSFGTEAITTNADTHTTTIADGSTDAGRSLFLKYTGTLDSACTITIGPNTVSKLWLIENATSGGFSIIIKQGSGATVTVPNGQTKAIYSDGAGSGGAMVDAFAHLNVVDLTVEDDLTITDDLTVSGAFTLTGNADLNGDLDVDGTTNLDVVDIDGAVDMASTLQVDGAFTSSSAATITVTDNSDTLTLKSTDADENSGPRLALTRDSGSPADNDFAGLISFNADDDGGNVTRFSYIVSQIMDASNGSEDGALRFFTTGAGSETETLSLESGNATFGGEVFIPEKLTHTGDTDTHFKFAGANDIRIVAGGVDHVAFDGTIVFNQSAADMDLRVETTGNDNMLFIDSGNDVVNIGGGTQQTGDVLSIHGSGTNTVARMYNTNAGADGSIFIFQKDSSSPADNDVLGDIRFHGNDDGSTMTQYAQIKGTSLDVTNGTEDGQLVFNAILNGTNRERLKINATEAVFNEEGQDLDFRVESTGNANMLLVDAGNDRVQIANLLLGEISSNVDIIQSTSSSGLLVDVTGDITFDADGGDVNFKDGGTTYGFMAKSSNDLLLGNLIADGDVLIRGNDGGSNITAVSFDMSDGGTAIFGSWQKMADNNRIVFGAGSDLSIYSDGTNGNILAAADLTLDVTGDIVFDADGGDFNFKDGGTTLLSLSNAGSNNVQLSTSISDGDLLIKGVDGGSVITALTLDMSAAGAATFNAGATFGGNVILSDIIASGSGGLALQTDEGTKRIIIADSGDIGLGPGTTPSTLLHLKETNDSPIITLENSSTATSSGDLLGGLQFKGNDATSSASGIRAEILAEINNTSGACSLLFKTAGTAAASATRMQLNSSGHLIVGSASHNDDAIYAIRGDNGKLIRLYHGTTEAGALSTKSTGQQVSLGSPTSGGGIVIGSDATLPANASGDGSNNSQDFGSSSFRWATIFAQNALNTSDEKLKQNIEELSEAEQRVAIACKGLIRKFKFKEDVVSKGSDAKIRIGIIAQQLVAAFEAEGLDAHDYALISLEDDTEQTETGMQKTGTQTYNVNYVDLLAFIISAV